MECTPKSTTFQPDLRGKYANPAELPPGFLQRISTETRDYGNSRIMDIYKVFQLCYNTFVYKFHINSLSASIFQTEIGEKGIR